MFAFIWPGAGAQVRYTAGQAMQNKTTEFHSMETLTDHIRKYNKSIYPLISWVSAQVFVC